MDSMSWFRPVLVFLPLVLLVPGSQCFELQDTIHALIQENIHLHDQLENLTQALRELKRLLRQHSNDRDHHDHDHHDDDVHHLREEWSAHGISAESQVLLERVLCEHEPHNSASPLHEDTTLLLLALPYLTLYLVGYL